ncbi:MAG TPA: flagellar hook-associated protein FlgK [Nitrospiraceae bacterium]|nr:flagellar hook-associated protein FlgK [Nitrospiraceae bacterium]
MGLTPLMGIGTSALAAFQRALAVTGHNISNVNTPGYSRQETILTETDPQNGRPGQVGSGVQASEIRRSVDAFVERQLTASHERRGQFEASRNGLVRVQTLFGDSNGQGLAAGLNEFFSAWQDVATNPSDATARTVLLSRAGTLASRFNQQAVELSAQRQALDGQIGQTITDINQLASRIAELNQSISRAEFSGQQANDLRDQRGVLVNQLGELADISTLDDGTGRLSVFIGRGQVLVDKHRSYALSGAADPSNSGLLTVQYDGGGGPIPLNSVIAGGRLKGLLDVRDQTIPSVQASFDQLASTVVTQVNSLHQGGYGLDGSTGQAFFSASGTTAATMQVTLTDIQRIAASSTAAGVPGNNANALSIGNLQTSSLAALGNVTFQEFYGSVAGSVGSAVQGAERDLNAQDMIHEQLEAHRAEISGVSLDEELVNLLKYQRAFQAASRLVVVADELLQTILTLKR